MVALFSTVRPSKGPSSVGVGTALASLSPAKKADAALANFMVMDTWVGSGRGFFQWN
jgi:hypothetical protein